MKTSKPTNIPPSTAPGKKIDDTLENPRGYLSGMSDELAQGHRKIATPEEMDASDHERNVQRMRKHKVAGSNSENTG